MVSNHDKYIFYIFKESHKPVVIFDKGNNELDVELLLVLLLLLGWILLLFVDKFDFSISESWRILWGFDRPAP